MSHTTPMFSAEEHATDFEFNLSKHISAFMTDEDVVNLAIAVADSANFHGLHDHGISRESAIAFMSIYIVEKRNNMREE